MAYQVLARKWRPHRFEEMVGQEHVLKALMNALDKQRLHHAYLFTGTRGVGKTTLARILARSLNCETGVSAHPCGVCSACQQINEGRFVDLIEVDAASRTKVDDTRELLDNVQYKPTVGRYKVYLIDEVHMLSNHSFNALLKTLEEPPEHVKFLLATTDPQKLPVTVLSRCLQFNLKRVPEELIAAHMSDILGREEVTFDEAALRALAQAADGSIRDGLSLLDQAIAFGDGQVGEAETVSMLGTISRQYMQELVEALSTGEAEAVLKVVEQLAEFSPDFKTILDSLITFFHDLALAQLAPAVLENRMVDCRELVTLAAQLSPEDVQLWYEIAVQGMSTLGLSSNPRVGFEMVLLRMVAFRPLEPGEVVASSSGEAKKKQLNPQRDKASVSADQSDSASTGIKESVSTSSRARQPQSSPAKSPAVSKPKPPVEDVPPWAIDDAPPWPDGASRLSESSSESTSKKPARMAPVVAEEEPIQRTAKPEKASQGDKALLEEVIAEDDWEQLLKSIELAPMVRELASNCRPTKHEDDVLTLSLSRRHEMLKSETNTKRLLQALRGHYGEALSIHYTVEKEVADTPAIKTVRRGEQAQLKAEVAIENDGVVKTMKDIFDASVVPGSIRPIK